jgi:hypothetical protein
MRLARAFDRYWFAPAPARRLASLRILIGGFAFFYVLFGFASLRGTGAFEHALFLPTGLVKVLAEPLSPALATALVALTLAAAVPFVLGVAYRITGPVFALLFLWITSYRNSWGMLFHTENLLALHLLVLAAAPAADAFGWDARRSERSSPDAGCYGWPARAMTCLTAVVYVLAGLAKLKLAGAHWLDGELLRAYVAYDNLRKLELGSTHSPLGVWLVRFEAPFLPFALFTLACELGAPLALFGKRLALFWTLAAWAFHAGVLLVMAIPFPYQLSFVAFAPFFAVERLLEEVGTRIAPLRTISAWRRVRTPVRRPSEGRN